MSAQLNSNRLCLLQEWVTYLIEMVRSWSGSDVWKKAVEDVPAESEMEKEMRGFVVMFTFLRQNRDDLFKIDDKIDARLDTVMQRLQAARVDPSKAGRIMPVFQHEFSAFASEMVTNLAELAGVVKEDRETVRAMCAKQEERIALLEVELQDKPGVEELQALTDKARVRPPPPPTSRLATGMTGSRYSNDLGEGFGGGQRERRRSAQREGIT